MTPVSARGAAGMVAGCGVLTVARLLPPDGFGGVPTCLFRFATGRPCPTCGLTRALVALAHGHAREALALHPLSVLVFALLIGVIAASTWQWASGRELLGAGVARAGRPFALLFATLLAVHWARVL